jgi:3-methylcrotonyl-CoA carboxylase alpha subunit
LKLPHEDAHVRVDAGVVEGGEVSMFYDPMIAKVIAWDETRTGALARLASALETAEVAGPRTNLGFLISALRHPAFIAAQIDTGFIERHKADLVPPVGQAPDDVLFLAALFQLLERRARTNGHSPWSQLDGWRLGGVRQSEALRLTDGGSDRMVGVTYDTAGWHLSLGEATVDADAAFESDGSISASLNGRRVQARVLRVGGDLVVLMRGRSFVLRPHDSLEVSDHAAADSRDLTAPMPGKIVQMLVKPGDRVRRGQALAIVEAMKMEHTLAAPGDLTVKTAPFRAGDQVSEGAIIVGFE